MNNVKPSYSAVDQFSRCERQFYYQRVLKLAQPASHYLSIGNLVHGLLADVAIGNRVDVTGAIERAKEAPDWMSDRTDPELERLCNNILDQVRKDVLPHLEVQAVEQWYRTPYLAKVDLLSGKTPAVDGRNKIVGTHPKPCVIDWKIKFSTKRREQSAADNSAQLALYCIQTGTEAAAFVELPVGGGAISTLVTHFTPRDLEYWRRYLDAQFTAMSSRGMDEGEYKLAPSGHPLCKAQFCTYWRRCPGGAGEAC